MRVYAGVRKLGPIQIVHSSNICTLTDISAWPTAPCPANTPDQPHTLRTFL